MTYCLATSNLEELTIEALENMVPDTEFNEKYNKHAKRGTTHTIGNYICKHLPLTLKILEIADIDLSFIKQFALCGWKDRGLPYSENQMKNHLNNSIPIKLIDDFIKAQEFFLATPFKQKEHIDLNIGDSLPFVNVRDSKKKGSFGIISKVAENIDTDKVKFYARKTCEIKGGDERLLVREFNVLWKWI